MDSRDPTLVTQSEAIKQALQRVACSCSGEGPVSECPILESLDPKEYKQ